jgi:hypothetical protein
VLLYHRKRRRKDRKTQEQKIFKLLLKKKEIQHEDKHWIASSAPGEQEMLFTTPRFTSLAAKSSV